MKDSNLLHRFRPVLMSVTAALLAFVAGCTSTEQQDAEIRRALDQLQATHAPDRRIAVFEIGWERGPRGIVAKGEVDQQQVKSRVLEELSRVTGLEVLDSIRVLPDTRLSTRPYGIIAVSVGNMRARPRHSAEMVTQVLMGMVVKLMKKEGGWYFVQSYDRYLGWIEGESMEIVSAEDLEQWRSSKRLITTATVGFVSEAPHPGALPVSDIVVGCIVKELGTSGRWLRVGLPDGRTGFVEASMVQEFNAWKHQRKLTPERIEKSALAFMGVPYLWGGTSAKGFDCSGFTKTVYRMNGLELNRDANQQALQGDDVVGSKEWANLRKGDLLFFGKEASDSLAERIVHVGIYLGRGEYIHCSGHVRKNSLDPSAPNYDQYNQKRFVRARRVIGARAVPEVF
jgi:gamma-D-glutamyl-L-lysine dipeptidyl-peptidase